MNKTGGLSMALGVSISHLDIYCLSDFSVENLLTAIAQVQVFVKIVF
jgi:hypothetical protein